MEAVERMRPELHAASEAAHPLVEEAEVEDEEALKAFSKNRLISATLQWTSLCA
jgi:hypothetical protein